MAERRGEREYWAMDHDVPSSSRAEIDDRWVALIEGRATRDEVSDWAGHYFDDGGVDDPCIRRGLGHLFSCKLASEEGNPLGLAEPPPVGEYLWTITELAERLSQWKSWCIEVDADPSKVPQVEHEVRLRLSDGSEVDGGRYTTFRRRSVGEIINLPDVPDGRAREGVRDRRASGPQVPHRFGFRPSASSPKARVAPTPGVVGFR